MASKDKVMVTARCKAFSAEGVRHNRCLVEPDGAVLVWDSVAGQYTRCHSLTFKALRRIRKLAGWVQPREG